MRNCHIGLQIAGKYCFVSHHQLPLRVFSVLKNSFNDQQTHSLEDYITDAAKQERLKSLCVVTCNYPITRSLLCFVLLLLKLYVKVCVH